MVNLLQAKKQFAAYCKAFDTQDERVALKILHSHKVAEISKQLAIHRKVSIMRHLGYGFCRNKGCSLFSVMIRTSRR